MAAVLFDFSGTLFRIESTDSWLRAALDEAGLALAEAELTRAALELERVGALPGGVAPRAPMPDEVAAVWGGPGRECRVAPGRVHRALATGSAAGSRPARRVVRPAHVPRRLAAVS